MRTIIFSFFLLIVFPAFSFEITDTELSNKIIGKWRAEYSEPNKSIGEGTYFSNGTHKGKMRFYETNGTVTQITVNFRWWIKDGQLFSTESLGETEASKKVVSIDTIVSINSEKMLLKTPDGRILIRTRIN